MGGKGEADAGIDLCPTQAGRMSADWGLKLFVLKLDIEKAFDTVIQSNMEELVMRKVAVEGGLP